MKCRKRYDITYLKKKTNNFFTNSCVFMPAFILKKLCFNLYSNVYQNIISSMWFWLGASAAHKICVYVNSAYKWIEKYCGFWNTLKTIIFLWRTWDKNNRIDCLYLFTILGGESAGLT